MQDAPWIEEAEREGAVYNDEITPIDVLLELCLIYRTLEEE